MSKDLLRDKLCAIGASYALNESGITDIDPENTIIDVVTSGEFPESKQSLRMVLAILQEHGVLFHPERLKAMVKTLQPFAAALLGGLLLKLINTGESKWASVCAECKKRVGLPAPQWSAREEDAFHLKDKGCDLEFKEFGIECPPVEPVEKRKIRTRLALCEGNLWFRNRSIFGANMRTDTLTVIRLHKPKNAHALKQVLRSSTDCAYRNWKSLESFFGQKIEIEL